VLDPVVLLGKTRVKGRTKGTSRLLRSHGYRRDEVIFADIEYVMNIVSRLVLHKFHRALFASVT
jgi:hypothetical protein